MTFQGSSQDCHFLYAHGFNFCIFLITTLIHSIFILLFGDASCSFESSLLIHIWVQLFSACEQPYFGCPTPNISCPIKNAGIHKGSLLRYGVGIFGDSVWVLRMAGTKPNSSQAQLPGKVCGWCCLRNLGGS